MEIKRKPQTRAQRNIRWIERHCAFPLAGPDKGERVRLNDAQCKLVRQIYDDPAGPNDLPIENDPALSAYLALLHICGPEAPGGNDFIPQIDVDSFTVWAASESPTLRPVLERRGEAVVCPALGTRYPRVA
jgi:hypothetical protein